MSDHWLLPTPELGPEQGGGIGTWADLCARALVADGDRVTLVAPARGAPTSDVRPYTVLRMPGRSWRRWGPTWLGLRSLPTLARKPTAVLAATWPLAAWLQPLADRLDVPLLVAAHGSELTALDTPPPALRRLSERVAWLPVSRFLGRELKRLGIAGPQRTLPVPLVTPPGPLPPRRPGLVWAGRPTSRKGIDRAVALAQSLAMPLELIGPEAPTGPLLSATGWLPREAVLPRLARRSALVLLPRQGPRELHQEGLGIVILEAALRETPAIGCATGGVPEAVGPGLILDDPDRPDLDAVRAFLSDPEAGERARAHAQQHHGPAAFRAALRAALGEAP